jgi:hypothetical protein
VSDSLPFEKHRENRSRPSSGQRAVSFFLLGLLLAIAFGIFWTQSRFDPTQWRLQPDSDDTAAADGHPMDAVAELHLLTPTETYSAETLSDKINGKAELYLSAGFKTLQARRFSLAGDPNAWMERYIYDMGGYRNAFAVFAAQRRSGAQPLSLARDAYASANGLFFVHGPYYVEIIAAQASEASREAAVELARAFIDHQTVDQDAAFDESALFPEKEQDPGSVSLIADNAFGIDQFDWVHTALYRRDGAEALAFISQRSTPAEALAHAGRFKAYFLEYGGETVSRPGLPSGVDMITIMDVYEIIAFRGNYVIGIHEATDPALAVDVFSGIVRQMGR